MLNRETKRRQVCWKRICFREQLREKGIDDTITKTSSKAGVAGEDARRGRQRCRAMDVDPDDRAECEKEALEEKADQSRPRGQDASLQGRWRSRPVGEKVQQRESEGHRLQGKNRYMQSYHANVITRCSAMAMKDNYNQIFFSPRTSAPRDERRVWRSNLEGYTDTPLPITGYEEHGWDPQSTWSHQMRITTNMNMSGVDILGTKGLRDSTEGARADRGWQEGEEERQQVLQLRV